MNNDILTCSEKLNESISQLAHLHTLEVRKKNQEQQAKNDSRYFALVYRIIILCQAVHYAQVELAFAYQPQSYLIGILNELQTAAINNTVDESIITLCEEKVKPIQDQVKIEWKKHYATLVGPIVNTLGIIRKIDPVQVEACLSDIQCSAEWLSTEQNLNNLKILSRALSNSNNVIARLALDQEITAFLSKVSSNNATLNDLSDGILNWIRKENLSSRILVTFK